MKTFSKLNAPVSFENEGQIVFAMYLGGMSPSERLHEF